MIKKQIIQTQNGHRISATFYFPEGDIKASALIVSAIGVSQNYYADFSAWLASQGYLVVTFDYFGTGLSLTGKLKDVNVSISDWAKNDCSAMIEAVLDEVPGKPFYWIGHSLGGQVLGFVNNSARITKAITIAAGSGYWLENSPQIKKRAWLLWYFIVPIVTRIFGYFPGKRLHIVGDLPKGVINQWRKWCLNAEYMVGAEGENVRVMFGSVKLPITSFSFSDDELMSEKNINSLHGFYTAANKKMIRILPEDIGEKRIGHFGFFKQGYKKTLWQSYFLSELS